jgi:hypothetical protein
MIENKPTRQYLYALVGEAQEMVREYFLVKSGKKVLTQEDREIWNKRKEYLHEEIKRVRRLI